VQVLDDLVAYIKRVHTTGLVWNKTGGDASSFKGAAAAPAPAAAAAAPKPAAVAASKPAGGDAKGGLFAALNQGGAVTSGKWLVTGDWFGAWRPRLERDWISCQHVKP